MRTLDGKDYNNAEEFIAKLMVKKAELEEENKKLKESLDIATKCSSKEEDGIIRLSEENKKLKENISWYEKEEDRLREENRKLKSDLAYERTMLDNVKAEYESLQNVIKKLKKRVKEHTTYSVKAEFIKKFGE